MSYWSHSVRPLPALSLVHQENQSLLVPFSETGLAPCGTYVSYHGHDVAMLELSYENEDLNEDYILLVGQLW